MIIVINHDSPGYPLDLWGRQESRGRSAAAAARGSCDLQGGWSGAGCWVKSGKHRFAFSSAAPRKKK